MLISLRRRKTGTNGGKFLLFVLHLQVHGTLEEGFCFLLYIRQNFNSCFVSITNLCLFLISIKFEGLLSCTNSQKLR